MLLVCGNTLTQVKSAPTACAQSGNASGAQKYGAALQKQWFGKVNMPDAFVWTYIAGDLGSDFARTNLQLPLRGERFGDDKQTAFMLNSFALTNSWNDKYGNNIAANPIYKEGFKQGLAARDEAAEKGDPWSLFYLPVAQNTSPAAAAPASLSAVIG